jgi:DNA-binding GntR family transcriptional regulator
MDQTGAREGAASHRAAVRTLPEQIADDLGAAIARGEFAGGERLLEQEIAKRYGVSRGPVREALRILAQRGLAVLYARRGAFVVEVSLDSLVDLFNTRAVLMGLAARYFAVMATDEARVKLGEALEQLRSVSKAEDTDPVSFVRATSRVGLLIARNCGSDSLGRLIEHQNDSSAWGSLWQSGRIDFGTRERRLTATGDYLQMGEAIEHRDGAQAEAVMRHMVMTSRESAVAALAKSRGETYDARRMLTA